ncbi:NACHT, LRR and PYD domains-containing protein 1a allele 5-like isoform X2 [Lithobates pipiens]
MKFGHSYRLNIESRGLFRCHSTGIQFLVSAAVTIEYTLESWSNYFPEIQKTGYKIAGPLFNIRTNGESEKILELYLPHYLCLNGITKEDHLIKCAHFVDGNILLETPSKIEPFYLVVEKPVFSLWGAIQKIWGKMTKVHGNVLMYFRILCMEDREKREYKIHLYLVTVPFLDEETLNRRKDSFHFQRIDKPPQTLQSVSADTDYTIYGGQGVLVLPKTLKINTTYPPVGNLPYTEITFRQNEITLQVLDQNDTVWEAWMSKADIEDLIDERHKRVQNKSSNKRNPDLPAPAFLVHQEESGIQSSSNPSPAYRQLLCDFYRPDCPSWAHSSGVHGAKSCQDLLLTTLNDMEDKRFKLFKAYLKDGDIVYPYTPIPCSDLEKTDRIDVANLLISHYTNEKAPIVANIILEAINEVNIAKELK